MASDRRARIIVATAERMPSMVGEVDRKLAVQTLVQQTVSQPMSTATLRRRARRMLEVVDQAYADLHQATLLAEQERRSADETWLVLEDNGDGTWSGRLVIPDLQAQLLLTHLQHLRAPRRLSRNQAAETVTDATVVSFPGLSRTESMGQAFMELCEHLPTDGLAQHGRVGATIAVHLDHQHLLDGLGSAHLDGGAEISAAEARRLACGAGILPVVYAGASVPVDLGRETRLFTKGQRIALSGLHDACAAEGCARPFAWCEIHHLQPWHQSGRTDLANALPLCGWHHRRAHDQLYDLRRLASGEVRFRRRPWAQGARSSPH